MSNRSAYYLLGIGIMSMGKYIWTEETQTVKKLEKSQDDLKKESSVFVLKWFMGIFL